MNKITVVKPILDNRQFLKIGAKKIGRIVLKDGRHLVEVSHPPGRKVRQRGKYEYASLEDFVDLLQRHIEQLKMVT